MLTERDEILPEDDPIMPGMIPEVVPPLPREKTHARDLTPGAAFGWLRAGWADLWTNPVTSLAYGVAVFVVSVAIVWLLYRFQMEHTLLPVLAGFLVVGPLIANGLYVKSRDLEQGRRDSLGDMIFVRMRSGVGPAAMMGVILLMLFMLWIRAAIILWAVFFGIQPFPGMDEILPTLFTTPLGWGLLFTGSVVGALFAAFAFAISVFAMPMLLEERTDALSAMGISMAMVWQNRVAMLTWGFIVMCLFALSVVTFFVGLILIFPLVGHGTWHAYRAIRGTEHAGQETERMFIPEM